MLETETTLFIIKFVSISIFIIIFYNEQEYLSIAKVNYLKIVSNLIKVFNFTFTYKDSFVKM